MIDSQQMRRGPPGSAASASSAGQRRGAQGAVAMSSVEADAARRERQRELAVTLPEPEPEPEPGAGSALDPAMMSPILRTEVALWRQQGERLLQRATRAVPTATMLTLPAAFAELVATFELELAQATSMLAFEANPEALRCVLTWAVSQPPAHGVQLRPTSALPQHHPRSHSSLLMPHAMPRLAARRMCGPSAGRRRSAAPGETPSATCLLPRSGGSTARSRGPPPHSRSPPTALHPRRYSALGRAVMDRRPPARLTERIAVAVAAAAAASRRKPRGNRSRPSSSRDTRGSRSTSQPPPPRPRQLA
jgi:hypothetical protein